MITNKEKRLSNHLGSLPRLVGEESEGKFERITCQREIILDYLKNVKSHPSAVSVFRAVRKKLPRISLGTVYRTLNNLREKGEILEIPSEVSRFDGDTSPHSHFICEKCGTILDIFEKIGKLSYNNLKVGRVKNYQVYFYGFCKICFQKSQ